MCVTFPLPCSPTNMMMLAFPFFGWKGCPPESSRL